LDVLDPLGLATSVSHFLAISDVVVFMLSTDLDLADIVTHLASNVEEKFMFYLILQTICM
jgi:hypothetical protein